MKQSFALALQKIKSMLPAAGFSLPPELGAWLRPRLGFGGQNHVISRINASLVLHENCLVNTENGEYVEMSAAAGAKTGEEFGAKAGAKTGKEPGAKSEKESGEEPGTEARKEPGDTPAQALAKAAAALLQKPEAKPHILLLMPAGEFAATSYSMSVSGEKLLRSALQLQSHTLLPACEEDLLLAVNAKSPEGVALWFSVEKSNELFRAFAEQGLFLAAIMPRSLALAEAAQNGKGEKPEAKADPAAEHKQTLVVRDETEDGIALLQVQDGVIKALLNANRKDLDQEVFASQWRRESERMGGDLSRAATALADWAMLRGRVPAWPQYCFFPSGAVALGKQLELARKSRLAAVLAVCVLLLLCVPYISSWFKLRGLEAEMQQMQQLSQQARDLQNSIYDMEKEWGAIYEYPQQPVKEILLSLNDVIEGSLTAFSINEGVINITGNAQDPAHLVELLAEKEAFYNVGQSTDTRGAQYGIRMNLSGVDFAAYEEKYPVLQQNR